MHHLLATCQISVKSIHANNCYSGVCEFALKREVSSIKQPFV